MIPVIITIIVVVFLILIVVGMYNGLIRARNRVDETLRQIDVRLQNRYELLPDLIQAVEKAVTTDQNILTRIAEVRSAANQAQAIPLTPENATNAAKADQSLTTALNGLRISVEAYPELRSQEAIQNFMNQDVIVQEKVAAARQIYNSTVREYNEKTGVFPSNIMAGMFNFRPATYFEATEEARKDITPDWGGKMTAR